jgi:hypothetical protein
MSETTSFPKPAKPPVPADTPANACGYARVSTVLRADEGQSLEVRPRIIAGHAQVDGMTVAGPGERGPSLARHLAAHPRRVRPQALPCRRSRHHARNRTRDLAAAEQMDATQKAAAGQKEAA